METQASQARQITPFHHAFPVVDLETTRTFYTETLNCKQGREDVGVWIDFDLFGHQIVAHKIPEGLVAEYLASKRVLRNHVDGHNVPVPHFGVVLEWDSFHVFAEMLLSKGVKMEISPYVRFKGMPGEQATMFFLDPSGNALEFKAFKDINNLFSTQ